MFTSRLTRSLTTCARHALQPKIITTTTTTNKVCTPIYACHRQSYATTSGRIPGESERESQPRTELQPPGDDDTMIAVPKKIRKKSLRERRVRRGKLREKRARKQEVRVGTKTPEQLEAKRIRKENIRALKHPDLTPAFANPTWSVRSLLPPSSSLSSSSSSSFPETAPAPAATPPPPPPTVITPKTLHHLLRLSALPPPASEAKQASMLSVLRTQLHFVRDIQAVDTTGVEPLHAIRDETTAGLERMVWLRKQALAEVMSAERPFGFHRRLRRVGSESGTLSDVEEWQAPWEGEVEADGGKRGFEHGGKTGGEGEKEGLGQCIKGEEQRLVEMATKARRENGYFVVEGGKAKRGE